MPELVSKYWGDGILVLLGYIIISNSLWLLFGSKLLQSLPGVNIKGAAGTLKIAILLIMTITGFFIWIIKFPFMQLKLVVKQPLQLCISNCIQSASKVFSKKV